MTSFVVEADGGSRGNPGPAGYGAVVKDASDGQVLAEIAEAIGTQTNNVAEYRGLIAGLRSLLAIAGDGAAVEVRMDSKLVIEQMAGRWKIKNEGLRPLATEAAGLARRLRVTWRWIPREKNKDADRLANEAMDAAAKGRPWRLAGASPTAPAGPAASGVSSGPATGSAPAGPAASGGPAAGFRETASWETASRETGSAGRPTASTIQDSLLDLIGEEETVAPAPYGPVSGTDPETTAATGSGVGTGWRPPTTVATSLLMLRHGETPFSAERRFSGVGDPELTSAGIAQAEAAAARLSRPPYGIQVVVSSPLKRARVTAEIVAARLGLEVEVEEGLREVDFGDWEGHTFTEIQRRWPDELAAWLADPSAAPPGGESFEVAARRVQTTGDRLVERYEGRAVLAVSHVTPIKMLLRFALEAPPSALYRMHLDLAALSLIEYYADGPAVVKAFNDTSHLR
ncbi:bifunctional RNase H/acid phosphatase [Streptosporangium pseudovulgare]|uniref:Bifunctional RNase H/acid phosphatase n=1 Tax=Streptosporangium pseudovulgare TaxID=35765 RepID=A0ABQ2QLY3_9ACTN|nr:bifunctional RNase H/acid phosphatase [Streptosporangium pseudovulgare]GGP84523.1 bifunctional RNase H/acid phosphatase [Streptosporangium pseudovulgare]